MKKRIMAIIAVLGLTFLTVGSIDTDNQSEDNGTVTINGEGDRW